MNPAVFAHALILRALSPAELLAFRSSAQLYQLEEDFGFRSSLGDIVAPAGFLTDFASVPALTKAYLDDDSPAILFGSVIHDWLYTRGGVLEKLTLPRLQADAILREAMLASVAAAGPQPGAEPTDFRL